MQNKKPRHQKKTTRKKKNKHKKRNHGKKREQQKKEVKMSNATRVKQKYPDTICVDIPKVSPNGRPEFDGLGKPKIKKEYGQYSGYLIARHGCWKKLNYRAQRAVFDQVYAVSDRSTPGQASKKRRSS